MLFRWERPLPVGKGAFTITLNRYPFRALCALRGSTSRCTIVSVQGGALAGSHPAKASFPTLVWGDSATPNEGRKEFFGGRIYSS